MFAHALSYRSVFCFPVHIYSHTHKSAHTPFSSLSTLFLCPRLTPPHMHARGTLHVVCVCVFLSLKGVIVSSLNLVAAAGGLVAGTVSDTLGRKRSIAAACLVFITGSIIKIAAQSFGYECLRELFDNAKCFVMVVLAYFLFESAARPKNNNSILFRSRPLSCTRFPER